MIQLQDIQLLRGTKVLLDGASAQISPGHKVGLIGSNGAGKSSLFALLKGHIQIESGECRVPTHWQIASVAQETPAVERAALEYVLDGDARFREVEQALNEAEAREDGQAIAQYHQALDDAGGYDIRARASSILHGLGFVEEQLTHPVSAFSGGWRMRLNLAQALLCPSDLMLLDEPTNHLDLDTVIWLEKWLQKYTGTLILISHDKAFLDNCVGSILSIEQQLLYTYTGGYSDFQKQRAERLRQQQIAFDRQQEQRAHLQSFIDRFRAKASKAKQAQSRIKQLEKMSELLPVEQENPFSFEFPEPPKLPNPLVTMEKVQVGYGDTTVLSELHLNLVPGSRIGLLGRNGAGKSTLVKLLAAELSPQDGQYHTSVGLQIGYFAQHQLETLQGDETPLAHLQRLKPNVLELELRNFLGGFGFQGDDALAQVAPMSGGEKARLVLAMIVFQQPNLLLLDEPTNHLDLNMRSALNFALQHFSGAMVLVSHDRFLLESVCDEFYLVDQGKVGQFAGDLEDYRQYLAQQTSEKNTKTTKPAGLDRKAQKRLEAEFRQQVAPMRKQLSRAEQQLEKLEQALSNLNTELADPDLYHADNKATLTELLSQQGQLKSSLEETETTWMELSEQLHSMEEAFANRLESS